MRDHWRFCSGNEITDEGAPLVLKLPPPWLVSAIPGSERVLKNELESLSEKVMKIQNNFRKSVNSELEKCAEICRKEKVNIEKKALLTAGR